MAKLEKPMCPDMTKTPIFYIRNRKITTNLQYPDVVITRDNKSRNFKFISPKIFDGADLSTKQVSVEFVNALGQSDQTMIDNITTNEDNIEFVWTIPGEALVASGDMEFDVCFSGDDYSWHTKPYKVKVETGLAVSAAMASVQPSVYEQWKVEAAANLAEIKQLKKEIEDLISSQSKQ